MATPTQYVFTQQVNYSYALASVIQQSSIVTALDHIDTVIVDSLMSISIWFKDMLSADDSSTLTSIMSSYVDPIPQPPTNIVTTQFELNNKDLKLAKAMCNVDPITYMGTSSIKIPGTFGSEDGRYVAGGYAISGDYNPDDYVMVRILDTDRNVAMALALASDPAATTPLSDATVQGMGVIPGFGSFPSYPIVKSYTDDDFSSENQGWYFWPNANGSTGFADVEPIGGYGFIPAGFYVVFTYQRPTGIATGSCRVNYYWGKME